MTNKSLQIKKVEEFREVNPTNISDEDKNEMSDFWLKKMVAEIDSDIPELNKDFTLSNLSDQMFESRVTNFIRNRIFVVKLLRNVFKYALRDIFDENKKTGALTLKEGIDEKTKQRVKWETLEYLKTRNLILSEVYTILNLSKARGGLVLKAFLRGNMPEEEAELIAGAETPAVGEKNKRSFMDKILGLKVHKKDSVEAIK